jgi:sterol desaturase/sphingolipid hydroxylase (fatty acid hydroxylase superfamily)
MNYTLDSRLVIKSVAHNPTAKSMWTKLGTTMQELATGLSSQARTAFLVIVVGYVMHSSLLQYLYYSRWSEHRKEWKIQRNKDKHVGFFYFHPFFVSKPDRGPYHRVLTSVNLLQAATFAMVVTEISVREMNKMQYTPLATYGVVSVLRDLLIAVTLENVFEYYWHRMMHLKFFYLRFHKIHHHYKSPEPFDDMYIHPLEAFGYYCILYSPPFLFRCHYVAFLLYMVIMGICGVLDHGGIRLNFPGLYCTEDHDAHHELFEVNYAFPFPFMDLIHGTYEGTYLGRRISCKRRVY